MPSKTKRQGGKHKPRVGQWEVTKKKIIAPYEAEIQRPASPKVSFQLVHKRLTDSGQAAVRLACRLKLALSAMKLALSAKSRVARAWRGISLAIAERHEPELKDSGNFTGLA